MSPQTRRTSRAMARELVSNGRRRGQAESSTRTCFFSKKGRCLLPLGRFTVGKPDGVHSLWPCPTYCPRAVLPGRARLCPPPVLLVLSSSLRRRTLCPQCPPFVLLMSYCSLCPSLVLLLSSALVPCLATLLSLSPPPCLGVLSCGCGYECNSDGGFQFCRSQTAGDY